MAKKQLTTEQKIELMRQVSSIAQVAVGQKTVGMQSLVSMIEQTYKKMAELVESDELHGTENGEEAVAAEEKKPRKSATELQAKARSGGRSRSGEGGGPGGW
jgi:predicted transcriptional regulator